jgi:predicted RNA-binding protein with EMAP domain
MKKEMNIGKMIKNIRYSKIILKHLLMTPQLKFELKHSIENIIDVDCSEDYEKG